jgi:hypothetical protein
MMREGGGAASTDALSLPAAEALEHITLGELVGFLASELEQRQVAASGRRVVDAAGLAEILGVNAETVRAHADELGVLRIGDGPKPRLRFDVEKALAAWTAGSADRQSQPAPGGAAPAVRRGRPRLERAHTAELLPIRGQKAA